MKKLISNCYWTIIGAIFGFGFISLYSFGIFIVLFGAAFVIINVRRGISPNLWATLVGMGGIPAIYLFITYQLNTCITNTPNCNIFYTETYHYIIWLFSSIAAVGVVGGLISHNRKFRRA